jgi:hypothetical protein
MAVDDTGRPITSINDEKELNEILSKRRQILSDLNLAYGDEAKSAKEAVRAELAFMEAKDNGSQQLDFFKKRMEEANEALDKNTQRVKDAILAEELQVRALQEQQKAVQVSAEETAKYTEAIQGTVVAMEKLSAVDMTKFINFGKSLKDTKVNMSAVVGSVMDAIIQVKDLQVNLARSSGFFRGFSSEILSLKKNNQDLFLTNEQLFETFGSLSSGLTNFLSMTERQRESTAVLAGEFKFLGVEASETAKILDSMTYAFGLNSTASRAAADGLIDIALETGRSLPSVTQEMAGMTDQLARFGKRGPQVFRSLAVQARRLGLTIKDAFDLTEQFDTFEGAANVAGRLNAQLGMQLNSVEIMSASSEDRLEILREEFKLQGLNFQSMGRRQKQMVAEIVAGGDVEKAARLFGAKIDVKKTETRESLNAKHLATMAEMTTALKERATDDIAFNQTVQDAMQSAAETLGKFQPLILGAITLSGLAQNLSQMKTNRMLTNQANARATTAANRLNPNAARGPVASPTSPTGFRDASGRFTKAPTPSTPAPKPTSMLRGGGFVKGMGFGGAATGLITAGTSAYSEYQESKSVTKAATRGALSGGGALAGMAAGAAIGSVIPVAGTFVGGLVGLLLGTGGAMLGASLGNKAADAVLGTPKAQDLSKDAKRATNAVLEQKKTQAKSIENLDRVVAKKMEQPVNMKGNVYFDSKVAGTFVTNTVDNAIGVTG